MSAQWRKSSFSSTGADCVEVADSDHDIAMRNSIHPDAGTIALPRPAFAVLLDAVRAGELDDLARA